MPTKFLGSDFQINVLDTSASTGILGNQIVPQVATLSDGRFAVLYQSDFQGNAADTDPVEAIFNSDGSFSSHATTIIYSVHGAPGLQTQPVVAARPGGAFGVAFTNVLHADGTADANGSNITYVPINIERHTRRAAGNRRFQRRRRHTTTSSTRRSPRCRPAARSWCSNGCLRQARTTTSTSTSSAQAG